MFIWWYLRRLTSADPAARNKAERQLTAKVRKNRRVGGTVAASLVQMLADPIGRPWVMSVLGSIGAEAAFPLRSGRKSAAKGIRTGAALCLASDPESAPALIELLRDEQAPEHERRSASIALGKLGQTDALLESSRAGNMHAIAGLWHAKNPAVLLAALDHFASSPGPARHASALELGRFPYGRIIIETLTWFVADEEEACWMLALGESLLSLSPSGRASCCRGVIEPRASGVVYGKGSQDVRLNDGCTLLMETALDRLPSVGPSPLPRDLVERLHGLSTSGPLRVAAERSLRRAAARSGT